MEIFALFVSGFAAIFASLVASFSGGGLSLILFPILLMVVPGSYASVLVISKVSAFAQNLVSGRIHAKKQKIEWDLFLNLTVTGVLGTLFGTYLVQFHLDEKLFKGILGVTLLIVSIYLLFKGKIGVDAEKKPLSPTLHTLTAVFNFSVSILNGLFGGSGIFTTVFLVVVLHRTFLQAIGTTIFVFAIMNLAQLVYLLLIVHLDLAYTFSILVGTIIGSQIGTHLQYLKGNKWINLLLCQ